MPRWYLRKMPRKVKCGQMYMFLILSLFVSLIFFILYAFYDLYHYDKPYKIGKILNLESSYNKSYPCLSENTLTYIINYEEKTFLRIRRIVQSSYTPNEINCCYSNVTLRYEDIFDDPIRISVCDYFEDDVELQTQVVMVKCFDGLTKAEIYVNAHIVIHFPQSKSIMLAENPLSILMIGVSGISPRNVGRLLPETYAFLNMEKWVEFEKYREIAPDVLTNIIAMLTGVKMEPLNRENILNQDLIWNDFKKKNYTLGYIDNKNNFLRFGHFLTYILACEKLSPLDTNSNDSINMKIVFNLIRNFISVKNRPFFGLFMIDDEEMRDMELLRFLKEIQDTKNTIVVIFSSLTNQYETTLTNTVLEQESLLYFSLPEWFERKRLQEYVNLMRNSLKVTTPYDIYMTLQDVFILSGFNVRFKQSKACPKCHSLFRKRFSGEFM